MRGSSMSMRIHLVVLSLLLVFSPVFAVAGNMQASAALAMRPPEGKAYICLFRLGLTGLDAVIRVDGVAWRRLGSNVNVVFEVTPGTHEIVADDDLGNVGRQLYGAKKKITVKAGDVYYVENIIDIQTNMISAANFSDRDEDYFLKKGKKLKFIGAFIDTNDEDNQKLYIKTDINRKDDYILATDSKINGLDKKNDAIAVIIGNKSYSKINKDIPDVDYAFNDADAIYRLVTENLGFDKDNVIFIKDATQSQLLSVFGSSSRPQGKLFKWVKPNVSDVFIYFSGHGIPGVSDGRSYLLPIDADPVTVEINGFSLDVLYANLRQLPAKSLTVVLDACFSGSSSGGAVFQNASSITLRTIDTPALLPNATVLTATGQNQVASWDKNARLGLFTRTFLDGVGGLADRQGLGNKDGMVTLGELASYLREEVPYAARRTYGREQEPQITGDPGRIITKLVQ